MTAGTILVRHPAGDLLIEAGNSSHFARDVSIYPFWLRLKLPFLAGPFDPDTPLPEMLRRSGEDPAKPRWAILSHVHLEHAGGLTHLPHLTVLMAREQAPFADDSGDQAKGSVLAASSKVLPNPSAPTLQFERNPAEFSMKVRTSTATARWRWFPCVATRREAWAFL
jgi:glyoxylase-like metal-dependent hydrolase (beta-lactamase superfamily II)